jgi:6-phosphofructokinase 1
MLVQVIGDDYFRSKRRGETAKEAIFTRKVGHTQRGGRPIRFDRFYASLLGGKAVEQLVEGQNNSVVTLQHTREKGFFVDSYDTYRFRDRWGLIHARPMHPALYDAEVLRPSQMGIDYLLPIFTDALDASDMEFTRTTAFAPGNLLNTYHSINTDVNKRVRFLED